MALNPHQKNKVDISSLSEEEQKLFRLYGKLPNKKDLFLKKSQERKYFDSGDYAMSKAGKSDPASLGGGLGREHPTPENIPHLSQTTSSSSNNGGEHRNSVAGLPQLHPTTSQGQAGSPSKEPSILARGMSVDDDDSAADAATATAAANETGLPIRK